MDPTTHSKGPYVLSFPSSTIFNHQTSSHSSTQQDIFNFIRGFYVVVPKGNAINVASNIFPNVSIEQIQMIAHQYFNMCQSDSSLLKLPKLADNYTGRNWYVNDKIKYYGDIFQGLFHGLGVIIGKNYRLHAYYINNVMREDYCMVELKKGIYRGSLKTVVDKEFNKELPSGIGQIIYHDCQDEYTGETLVFAPHGKGTFYSMGRYRIEGTFNKNLPHGDCTYTFKNEATFLACSNSSFGRISAFSAKIKHSSI